MPADRPTPDLVPTPPPPESGTITMLLDAAAAGDTAASSRLLAIVYDHLSTLARALIAMERFDEAEALYLKAQHAIRNSPNAPAAMNGQIVQGLLVLYEAWNAAHPSPDIAQRADAIRAQLPRQPH